MSLSCGPNRWRLNSRLSEERGEFDILLWGKREENAHHWTGNREEQGKVKSAQRTRVLHRSSSYLVACAQAQLALNVHRIFYVFLVNSLVLGVNKRERERKWDIRNCHSLYEQEQKSEKSKAKWAGQVQRELRRRVQCQWTQNVFSERASEPMGILSAQNNTISLLLNMNLWGRTRQRPRLLPFLTIYLLFCVHFTRCCCCCCYILKFNV